MAKFSDVHDADDHSGVTGLVADAANVTFTPAGSIAATDVQAAIEEVAAEAGGGGGANYVAFIPWFAVPSATSGTWTATPDIAFAMGGYRITDGAQNRSITYQFFIDAGTYTFGLLHGRASTRGIYTVTLDGGSSLGTIDGYSVSSGPTFGEVTSITVATSGIHTITLTMATKNASSSNYFGVINGLTMSRTGA